MALTEKQKEWNKTNPEKVKQYKINYYYKNKDKSGKKSKECRDKKKNDYLSGKHCVWVLEDGSECDSTEDLQIDHIIPRKISGREKFSWNWHIEKIIKEIEEHCQVLCGKHNREKETINGETPRGEETGSAKLKEKEVIEIRNLYSGKIYTQKELAIIYNVTQSCISLIVRNKNWRHL